MSEGKGRARRRASPLEVARTLLATTHDLPPARTLESERDATATSGIHERRAAATLAEPEPDAARRVAPELLDRYQRVGLLGSGGMGRVDEVYDGLLGRTVAKKAALGSSDEHHAALLVAEAQTCAQLEHPSIVPVYDIGVQAGQPFYTMRVVRGKTLRDVLEDSPRVPLAQLLGILRQVCLAVDYAHSRKVVHRDLKPDNIVLGEFGEVYVVDWGIAHVQEGSSVYRASSGPAIAGTPGYMAPEQLDGGEVDGRADVFALGVILYEIISGARPFSGTDIHSVVERRTKTVDVPPSRRDPAREVPAAFDALVLACLAPEPAARPARARAISEAIDLFLDGERARAEREREAHAHAREGDAAFAEFRELDARARELGASADALLAKLPGWESAELKAPAWRFAAESRELARDAARSLAQAEVAYARALGRVADHRAARRGLAALYYQRFEAAEALGDEDSVAQLLSLARAYDDGDLALELANRGELVVESEPPGANATCERYEARGPLLRRVDLRALGPMPANPVVLDAGSYLVRAVVDDREVRYPVVIQRAVRTIVRLRIPEPGTIPRDMVLIPGGQFLALPPGHSNVTRHDLPDFAIGRFPVTAREYAEFLDALDGEERIRRTPQLPGEGAYLVREQGVWRLGPNVIEGEARKRVPPEHELDLPVAGVRWWDAVAYAAWRSAQSGLRFRLPTELEWQKAMRGADGRPFPMGRKLDPAFAKTRDSRPEASQLEPVGTFPLDESPYGVRDLAGGVADWTSTFVDGEPPPIAEGDDAASDRQVFWCGATWSSSAAAQADMRYAQAIRHAAAWIGFRLALSLDPSGSSTVVEEPMRKPRA